MSAPAPGAVVVACTANEAYSQPLAAMVRSILNTLAPGRALRLYIFDGGISAKTKKRLSESWAPQNPATHWIEPEEARFRSLPLWGRMTLGTYYRLLAAELIPQVEPRVIWLDSDLLVRRDLGQMFDLDAGANAILAARDLVIPCVSSRYGLSNYAELGLAPETPFFNAGVMALMLERWRELEVGERAMDYIRRNERRVNMWDQDGLNAALLNAWGQLDPRWNQIASVAGRPFFRAPHLDPETYRQVVEDPWIVHYAGFWKPWAYENGGALRRIYFETLDQTAWRGTRPPSTLRMRALGVYESSLRKYFYRAEPLYHRASRLRSRWRRPKPE